MKIFSFIVAGLFACTLAQAQTCQLKYGYYVSCSGGAGKISINGVEIGGCEWLSDARKQVLQLQQSGACSRVQVINTDCEVPGLFQSEAEHQRAKRECYARSNHL